MHASSGSGRQKIDGKWFYYDEGGSLCVGWKKVDGAWYYLDDADVMATGWKKVAGAWYYLDGAEDASLLHRAACYVCGTARRQGRERMKHFDSIDLLKFVLALMVVLIHVNPFPANVYVCIVPLLRMAVPLFFLISAFFFFRKIETGGGASSADIGNAIKRASAFTRRNLCLYGFWLLVLLVPTLMLRDWFSSGLLNGCLEALRSFFFQSTFIASWYIMALVISVWLVLVASMVLRNSAVVLLMTPVFVTCCLMSNYRNVLIESGHLATLVSFFGDAPYNSFWAGLFWVSLGKYVADCRGCMGATSRQLVVLGVIGLMVLGAEQFIIQMNHFAVVNDSFFSLPLVVVPAFLLLLRLDINFRGAAFLRAASTVVYCLHGTLRYVLVGVGAALGCSFENLVLLLPVIGICLLATWGIMAGEGRKGLSWLRFAH